MREKSKGSVRPFNAPFCEVFRGARHPKGAGFGTRPALRSVMARSFQFVTVTNFVPAGTSSSSFHYIEESVARISPRAEVSPSDPWGSHFAEDSRKFDGPKPKCHGNAWRREVGRCAISGRCPRVPARCAQRSAATCRRAPDGGPVLNRVREFFKGGGGAVGRLATSARYGRSKSRQDEGALDP